MTHALIIGPDRGLESALTKAGVETTQVPSPITEADLDEAGLSETGLLFVTDAEEATAIPVAKGRHPPLRIVWYAAEAVPAFVTRQLDLGVDPALVDPDVLVEEQLQALGA